MNIVEYTLLNISVTKEYVPGNAIDLSYTDDEVKWHFKFFTKYTSSSEHKTHVTVNLNYFLYLVGDPDKKSIVTLETESLFQVTRNLPIEAKWEAVLRFLEIATWNLQGIYAVKTENSPLNRHVPSIIPFKDYKESIKSEIQNVWL